MSDIMRPIPFDKLMNWVFTEYSERNSVFGVSKFYRAAPARTLPLFRERLELPFGPAAGPHTQLAQNIIAAYVAGSRFFELKTVQVMDGAELSACIQKPCINAQDEGYNCEWSTELTVQKAFDEYVKAWFALKLIGKELGLGGADGFIFNMSVGYDLAGIRSQKIDNFIEGLKDASGAPIWAACKNWAFQNLKHFKRVDAAYIGGISPKVSASITLSTLHGCPPEEIERIAAYLIEEKGLNTFVKCNPTLLGYGFARNTLDQLGFDYLLFDDHHFNSDLQYGDAVPMFRRLMERARKRNLSFGVKLTNTFPVRVGAGELPAEEMYMSGRSLYPLTVELARRFSMEFGGKLRISFSGGADAWNLNGLFAAGIWPITLATTLLKSGGYERIPQLCDQLAAFDFGAPPALDPEKAAALAADALVNPHYRKPMKPLPKRKMALKLPLTDCFTGPCAEGCPIGQDVPAYLRLAGEGRYLDALRVITERNPLPFLTGTLCPHTCQDKCMRNHVDEAVGIRLTKLDCAENGYDALLPTLKVRGGSDKRVAIVGGGPAGLSAAFFLTRAGCDVTVFEKSQKLGGVVRHVIPDFRISDEAIDRDIALCLSLGAQVKYGAEIRSAAELNDQGFDAVVFACGAPVPGDPGLAYGDYVNFSDLLSAVKRGETADLGRDVAVIGGGNSAMDTARLIKRIPGVEHVRLVYRRTKRYMPADEEELRAALADGVEFLELLAPLGVKDGVLTCKVMSLGAPDQSGRRSPVDTGDRIEVRADTVVTAVGDRADPSIDTFGENIYVIGDQRRGPATIVLGIADAIEAAQAIAGIDFTRYVNLNRANSDLSARFKTGRVVTDISAATEPYRCLECPTVCEACVTVCPNRANVSVVVEGRRQIVHVDGMCNECGNCGGFCPYDSDPYREKLTLFWSAEDFAGSGNEGFLPLGGQRVRLRLDGQVDERDLSGGDAGLSHTVAATLRTVLKEYAYMA